MLVSTLLTRDKAYINDNDSDVLIAVLSKRFVFLQIERRPDWALQMSWRERLLGHKSCPFGWIRKKEVNDVCRGQKMRKNHEEQTAKSRETFFFPFKSLSLDWTVIWSPIEMKFSNVIWCL